MQDPLTDLTFDKALNCLRKGWAVSRDTWHDPEACVVLHKGQCSNDAFRLEDSDIMETIVGAAATRLPHLELHTPQEYVAWLPGNADLFADDWYVVQQS